MKWIALYKGSKDCRLVYNAVRENRKLFRVARDAELYDIYWLLKTFQSVSSVNQSPTRVFSWHKPFHLTVPRDSTKCPWYLQTYEYATQ